MCSTLVHMDGFDQQLPSYQKGTLTIELHVLMREIGIEPTMSL